MLLRLEVDAQKKVPVFETSFPWKTNLPKSATRVYVMYLADICIGVIMRLARYFEKGVRTRMNSSLDSGSQLKTDTCPIIIYSSVQVKAHGI